MTGMDMKIPDSNDELEALRRKVAELESETAALGGELRRSREECERLLRSRFEAISFIENASVGVIIQTADGRIAAWNQMGREIFGASPSEIGPGESTVGAWEILHPDGSPWPAGEHPSMVTLRTGRAFRDEPMLLRARDGRERWLAINTEPVFGEAGGKPEAIIITFLDITEAKRDRDALTRQDALLQALLRNLPFDFWARDLDRRIIIQSDASVRLWGDLADIAMDETEVSPEILQSWQEVNARAYAGEVVSGEKRYTLPSGETRIYRDIVAPIRSGRDILGILGTNIDVTDHVRTIEALHRSEANLASLLDSIEESAALFEPDGTVITANQTFAARVGRTVDQCVGHSIYILIPPEVGLSRRGIVEEIIRTGRPQVFEDERNGRWMRHRLSPVLAPDGTVMAVSTFATDLTERRRREKILVARQRMSEYAIHHSLKELLRMALDEAEAVTESTMGFLHFFDEESKSLILNAWSTRTLDTGFQVGATKLHYDVSQAGIWADCVRERRPVIHNDYMALTHRKGVPDGHPFLSNLLLMPVVRSGRIVAILALANKAKDFTEEDVQALTELGNLLWDIIEHKRAQEDLAKSENLLSMAQSLGRIGGWEWDADSQTMSWTRELYRLHGIAPDSVAPDSPELIERSLACYPPEDRDAVQRGFRDCLESGVPYDLEVNFIPEGGNPMRVRTSGEAFHDGKRVTKVRGIFMDITEIRALEQRYSALFRNMQEGFALHEIICDAAGKPVDYRFLDVNPAFERHTGLEARRIVGRTVREVMPGIERIWIETYGHVALTGETAFFEEYAAAQDKFFQVSAFRPAPLHFACIFSDITARKRHERELRQARDDAEAASLAKSEFLANMSHEIRTPLNGILGILQLFDTLGLDEEHRRLIKLATNSAHRLTGLLTDLLDLSRIESGKLVHEERAFEPAELRDSTLGLFALAARDKGLRIDFVLDPKLSGTMIGNESRLRQVLFNLVGNAIKFTQAGFVTVEACLLSCAENGACKVCFCVEDSGTGIPDDCLDDVFEPFVQGEQAYVRRHQGAGLGLAIVKRLVGVMGGSLCVDNAEGGTTFCFSLPLRRSPDPALRMPHSASASSEGEGRLQVLLVEDDAVSMFATRRVLEKAGHAVTPAEDGREAVRLMREGDFDLILMDVQLPVMDGLQATAVIRSEDFPEAKRRIPIIAMTAYAMTGDRERFLAAGMDGYLAKPVSAAELLQALRRWGA